MRIVPVGESLQSQDNTRIGNAYDWNYSRLERKGLTSWASDGSMPTEITPHFVALMALRASEYFGVSQDIYQKILIKAGQDGQNAEREIRALVRPAYDSTDEPTDF